MRVKAWGMQGSPGIRHLVAYEVCLRLVLQKLFLKTHYLAWNVSRLLCQVGARIGKGGLCLAVGVFITAFSGYLDRAQGFRLIRMELAR